MILVTAILIGMSVFITGKALGETIHRGPNINLGWMMSAILWATTYMVGTV